MENSRQIDLARLAAYIDGEGCIRTRIPQKLHGRGAMSLAISNTDPRLIVWLTDHFGGNAYHYKGQSRSGRRMYRWELSSWKAASILSECLPFFVIKRDQAELAIAFQATIQSRRKNKPIHPSLLSLREDMVKRMEFLHRNCPDNPSMEVIQ